MAFAAVTISTVVNVINAINDNNNNNNNINDLDSNNENMNPAKRRNKRWQLNEDNNGSSQWCEKLGETSPRCMLAFIENEKRVKARNPGFEGIKKWLEVFLLNGVVDGSVSQKWRAPAAEVETENGSHLQLSTLIVEELKKLKSFYVNT